MSQLPSAELLDQTHTFPCTYSFKAIGNTTDDFALRVVAAVRAEFAAEADPPFTLRKTDGGRHVAVTLEPVVQSSAQVLAVYDRIRHIEGLILLL